MSAIGDCSGSRWHVFLPPLHRVPEWSRGQGTWGNIVEVFKRKEFNMFARIPTFSRYIDGARTKHTSLNEVEVSSACGCPSMNSFGIPNGCGVLDRVRCAIRETGKVVTGFNTTINVRGTHMYTNTDSLDLAVAMGLLVATGEAKLKSDNYVFFGNLSLDGRLNAPEDYVSAILADVVLDTYREKVFVIPTACKQYKPSGVECILVPSLAECIKVCCE